MTWTRTWQGWADTQSIDELQEYAGYGTTSITVSNTKAKTGSYSFRSSIQNMPRGKSATLTQLRAGAFFNHNGVGTAFANARAIIFLIPSTVGDIYVGWHNNTSALDLVVNGTVVDSIDVALANFSTTNVWYHCGITCKADAAAGFVSFYIDGVQVLSWTGNTGTSLDGCYCGGRTSGSFNSWNNYMYFDDFYLDSGSGEADAAPPSLRFDWSLVDAAGSHAAWTPSAGTNISNVDDAAAHDSDTTYNSASAAGLKDAYNTAAITVPAGYVVAAVIAVGVVRKTDAGTASQVKLGTRESGGTESLGSAQSPATSYGIAFERQTTKPSGGSWSESDVNGAQFLIESAGTF